MNNKEIGGFFETEKFISNNGEYYPNFLKLNSGRNALLYVIKAKKIKKIYIPLYLCDSIVNLCEKYSINYKEYKINADFSPNIDFDIKKDELLLIVNYFGQLSEDRIIEFKNIYKNIIIDNTQAFFSKPVLNVDTFYSCRKYFGVPDGSYLFTGKHLKQDLINDDSSNRMKHIVGRSTYSASDYYSSFLENEKIIDNLGLMRMSSATERLLSSFNYPRIIERRNSNFEYLHKHLSKFNLLKIVKPFGPFCYPLYVKNGQFLREKLIKNRIYVPIFWPYAANQTGLEKEYAINIVPIPCDQRYDEKDMKTIIEIVKKILL